MGLKAFFKKAFGDMKESAKQQHEVDKANFNAVKAESKATWEEAKMSPSARQAMMQEEREKQIAEANARTAAAQARIDAAKNRK
ncbi:MAG: hypothetical protein IJY63_04340 [Clostridia bacterium]|nr:hypothetical protein [Clostridia bacterium]